MLYTLFYKWPFLIFSTTCKNIKTNPRLINSFKFCTFNNWIHLKTLGWLTWKYLQPTLQDCSGLFVALLNKSQPSARGRFHANLRVWRRRELWVMWICACAKYKNERCRERSRVLKATFIDLLINYSWQKRN
jgi:hypothetical protein